MLGDAVVAWWDVLDVASVDRIGDAVTGLRDRSGTGNDLNQPNPGQQPKWVEHAVTNSFEAAVYDGRNDRLEADFDLSGSFTVCQMIQTGTLIPDFASSFQGGNAGDAVLYVRNADLGNAVAISAGNLVSTGKVLLPETNYIIVAQFNGAGSRVSINGEVFETPNIGSAGVTSGPRV